MDLTNELLSSMFQYLSSAELSITVADWMTEPTLTERLFSDNPMHNYFNRNARFCSLANDKINIYPHLTHLSIELGTMLGVFIVVSLLPNLQFEGSVNLGYLSSTGLTIIDAKHTKSSETLRHVAFTGASRFVFEFHRFFEAFGSTIESLTMNMLFKSSQLNGFILERDLLNKMPRTSSMDLAIHWRSRFRHQTANIEQFRTPTWQKFNPIVYWYDIKYGLNTIYTLPYKFNHFSIYSDDFISSCITNRPMSVCFEHVRSLSMASNPPWWTIESLKFIQTAFPNVKTLYLTLTLKEMGSAYYEEDYNPRWTDIFSDDFLSNTTVQFSSVTKLCLVIERGQYHIKILRFLSQLLPYLISMGTNDMKFVRNYMYRDYDFMKNRWTGIKLWRQKGLIDPYNVNEKYSNDDSDEDW